MIDNLPHYWDLTVVLVKKEFRIRYKSSVLGYLWSILTPLTFALVLCLAFQMVFRIGVPNYPLFLISALFPWQWFANSINVSGDTFLGNASLIKKTIFPKSVIVLAMVLQDMIHFVLSLPVIAAFTFYYRVFPSLAWLYGIPLLLIIQFALTFGAALLIASVNLFFRDMTRLVSNLVMLLFYCTPIVYTSAMIPARYQWLLYANPIAPLMINWRAVLIEGRILPDYLLWSAGHALVFLFVGYRVYERLRYRFAEVL